MIFAEADMVGGNFGRCRPDLSTEQPAAAAVLDAAHRDAVIYWAESWQHRLWRVLAHLFHVAGRSRAT
jgi:hypothetical protein